ncbi:MAG: TonB-dependent receptor [Draconibacterium sp.]
MKNILTVWVLVLIFGVAAAQPSNEPYDDNPEKRPKTDAMLFGDVQSEGEHVPFANITLKGTTIGVAADATGHFKMTDLPVGKQKIVVSAMGFKPLEQDVNLISNEMVTIRFELEPDYIGIEQVVVSANRNQTNRKEAPVVVTSISSEVFKKTQSVNLAEGLAFTPGLRTETNCQNCGFTQLRMNGLDGPYTQILMNSRPVFSGLAGVYGLEMIPANMVERIEVVRGGGSALFGGNAIAGTVNIITQEPVRNTFSAEARTGIIGVGGDTPTAMDYQFNGNAAVVTDDGSSGGYIYAMFRDRNSYDENGDGFTEAVMMENSTFGFNVFHKPGTRSKISIDGYRINEYRRGGNKLDYLAHEADIAEELTHLITGANLAYDLFINDKYDKFTVYVAGQKVKRDSYYGARQDPFGYGFTEDFTSVFGAQYILNSDNFLFAPSSTIFGIDNNNNQMEDNKLGAEGGLNTLITDQMVNTFGSFVQHDWKTRKLNVSAGLRFDNYLVKDKESNNEDLKNSVLAPRLSFLYRQQENIRYRIGYAKGYRAPQVFNEDLHIELVNAKRVIHINSDDLIQETSHSFSASFNADFYVNKSFNGLLIEGFYTKLKDPFADEYYPLNDEGDWAYQRVNAEDGAQVFGVNMEWNAFISPKLETQVGFTLQKSVYDVAQPWGESDNAVSKDFMRTPNAYGYATADWHPHENFGISFAFNYTGSMYVPHFGLDPSTNDPLELEAISKGDVITGEKLEKSEDFFIFDLLFDYHFHLTEETQIRFYAGVKNIFNQTQNVYDKGMFRDAGYIYGPSLPRTINFGLKI